MKGGWQLLVGNCWSHTKAYARSHCHIVDTQRQHHTHAKSTSHHVTDSVSHTHVTTTNNHNAHHQAGPFGTAASPHAQQLQPTQALERDTNRRRTCVSGYLTAQLLHRPAHSHMFLGAPSAPDSRHNNTTTRNN